MVTYVRAHSPCVPPTVRRLCFSMTPRFSPRVTSSFFSSPSLAAALSRYLSSRPAFPLSRRVLFALSPFSSLSSLCVLRVPPFALSFFRVRRRSKRRRDPKFREVRDSVRSSRHAAHLAAIFIRGADLRHSITCAPLSPRRSAFPLHVRDLLHVRTRVTTRDVHSRRRKLAFFSRPRATALS